MSDEHFRSAHISEIEPIVEADPGDQDWLPVRHHLGVSAFGVNAWVAREAGDLVIEPHDEAGDDTLGHEELYFVTNGHARFTIDGQELEAPEGTFVFVGDPNAQRMAIGQSAGTTVLAIGAPRGAPFTISPWEKKHTSE